MTTDLADTLRTAITASGISARQLGISTGVNQTTISRFLGGADMTLATASVLAEHLGVSVQVTEQTPAPKLRRGRPRKLE